MKGAKMHTLWYKQYSDDDIETCPTTGSDVGVGGQSKTCKVPVIQFHNACKTFKNGSIQVQALENFCMEVPRGTIYSLLGSSGCGKTTVLSCAVGVQKLDSGDALTFGLRSGDLHQLGSSVGYMPQDVSLHGSFSIEETLTYFGIFYGMKQDGICNRVEFLIQMLGLPDRASCVRKLSEGQQRRVSFAVAVIHQPQLLVLDEPTAGVDPILRECIWKHLLSLTERKTTVLLTTHYVDEARHSSMIGVMHNGRLIAQDSPHNLMQKCNSLSLESVMLTLYRNKDDAQPITSSYIPQGIVHPDNSSLYRKSHFKIMKDGYTRFRSSKRRVEALVSKNMNIIYRNIILFIFMTCTPAAIMYATCISYSYEPKHMSFGVVNKELRDCTGYQTSGSPCEMTNLSCKFVALIPSDDLNLEYYDKLSDAVNSVKSGHTWGYISFPKNFSANFLERAAFGKFADDLTLNMSTINVQLDQSNSVIRMKILNVLYKTYFEWIEATTSDCGFDPKRVEFPLQYHEPVFGKAGFGFVDYVAPAFALGWLLFFPLISTSVRFIGEKRQGLIERYLTAGTHIWEILAAYAITEFAVLIVQSILVYFILCHFTGLGNVMHGSPHLGLALCVLSGLNGMALGFLLGILCRQEIHAVLLSIAILFPNSFISGAIWPTEGMPEILQIVSPFLPSTMAYEAMRSLLNRNWELSHPNVWPGFTVLALYTLLYLLVAIHIHKRK